MKLPWLLRASRLPSRARRRPLHSAIEGLEDRSLMSTTVYVVPLVQTLDVTHRHTLMDAMSFAGPTGTVYIEPGAAPDAGTVNVTLDNLTIKGDPNVGWGSLPLYNLNVSGNGVFLSNMNLGNVTVANTATGLTVNRSQLGSLTELGAVSGAGHNTLSYDTITGAVDLQGNSGLFQVTSDLIVGNHFASSSATMLKLTNSNLSTIDNNTFVGDGSSQVGIQVRSNSDQVTIANNHVKLTGTGSPIAIVLINTGGAAGNILGARVLNNTVETSGNGVGLYANIFGTGAFFTAQVEGNEFQGNKVGIDINGITGSATGAGNIDVGGGSNAFGTSKGANNFRGYDGIAGHYAVHLHNTDAGITVEAQQNIFDVGANPALAIQDANNGGGTGIVNFGNALDGNHAFVQNLFTKLLGRAGDPAAAGEIDQWVAKLPKLGRKGVTKAILYSDESLGRLVNQIYANFVGAEASPDVVANWVKLLKKGVSLSRVEASILSSPEFVGRLNTSFVQAVYLNVLHRPATALELSNGYKAISTRGLKGFAASITGGMERRLNFAGDLHKSLLHREPTALEATTLAGKSGNLLTLNLLVLSGDEFFNHG